MSNIIVTGAGSGIGYHTVLNLLKDGSNTVVGISRTLKNLQKLEAEAEGLPGKLSILSYDVTDYTSKVVDELLDSLGVDVLDILINDAASLIQAPFDQHKPEDYRQMMEVNYIAPAMMIRRMLPRLKKSDGAHIVNVSSVAGVQGSSKFPGVTAYSGSKAAIISLTECLAQEYFEEGIRVNAVAFGAVQTRMLEENFPDYKAPVTAEQAGSYLSDLALNGSQVYNGKVLAATVVTPY